MTIEFLLLGQGDVVHNSPHTQMQHDFHKLALSQFRRVVISSENADPRLTMASFSASSSTFIWG
jgi:hypothetical protein